MTEDSKNTIIQIITTDALWYKNDFLKAHLEPFITNHKLTKKQRSIKSQVLKIFKTNKFITGSTGYNWDQWRKLPINSVVIHHTSSSPTISLNELSVLELLRLYVPQYLKDQDVKNMPIFSGHFLFGKEKTAQNMTFATYHFLIRPGGKVIQINDINNYLWHAGNLEINQKSIGIAFAGKFIDKEPTELAIKACASLIKDLGIDKQNVLGHSEVINKKILGETICPGSLFTKSWKQKILDLI